MADHAAAAASPGGDYYCLCAYDFANEGIAWVVTVLISVVYLSVISFLFPLQARYENPAKVTVRNALVLGVGMLPLGVLMNVVNYFPILVYLSARSCMPALWFGGCRFGSVWRPRSTAGC